jgi:hypothetical protein
MIAPTYTGPVGIEIGTLYSLGFPYGFGVFLASAFIYAAHRMRSDERWLFTWVMAVVVAGFVWFPLSAGDLPAAGYEALVLLALLGGIAVSWRWKSGSTLALVYFAHGAWDLVHLFGGLSAANPAWIHQICVPFDWILGCYIVSRTTTWTNAAAQPQA